MTTRTDTERLDWMAYDQDAMPIFDGIGDTDVHLLAAESFPADREPTIDEVRDAYRQAFRTVIDAAMDAASESGQRKREASA